MGLSFSYGSVGTHEESLKVSTMFPIVWRVVDPLLQVLDAARESGCTFWDTVDAYDGNKDLIAR
jgi:aryl-alcohol dehydrogenase-like predicted oxidoreductase